MLTLILVMVLLSQLKNIKDGFMSYALQLRRLLQVKLAFNNQQFEQVNKLLCACHFGNGRLTITFTSPENDELDEVLSGFRFSAGSLSLLKKNYNQRTIGSFLKDFENSTVNNDLTCSGNVSGILNIDIDSVIRSSLNSGNFMIDENHFDLNRFLGTLALRLSNHFQDYVRNH